MPPKQPEYGNVKQFNRNRVFMNLYGKSPRSSQDIAYDLRLSLPTVIQCVNKLKAMDLVSERDKKESTGGRRAVTIEPNYGAKYSIGLDVTKNHLGIVVIDLGCNVLYFKRHRLPFNNSPKYFEKVGSLIENTIADEKIDRHKVLGVGISIPAILSEDSKVSTFALVIDFMGGRLSQFAKYIPYQCILINDANAAGYAEAWHRGLNEGDNTMFYISLSNSVGGSFFMDGYIHSGSHMRAGEAGHSTVRYDGPLCYCGKRGCLDATCNAATLSKLASGKLENFFKHVGDDPALSSAWDKYLDDLSIAVNSIHMLLDCNIVLGGYVGNYLDTYLEDLKVKAAERNTFGRDAEYLDTCKYKFEASAVGAALYYINDFIKNI